mgnify:CR=1 FL=1
MKKGLYYNINRRRKLGISRSKKKSTISAEAYANMKKGFPKKVRDRKSMLDQFIKETKVEDISPSIPKTLIWHVA